LSRTEPNIIIPLPHVSWAWAMVPFSPGTTKCFSNPNAWQSHSIAAGAFRYRIAGIIVAGPFFDWLDIGNFSFVSVEV
jgi:hypothetical protein